MSTPPPQPATDPNKTTPPTPAGGDPEKTRPAQASGSVPVVIREPYSFLSPADRPGDLGRLGPYRVVKLLGQGGMGFVFRGEDDALRRPVALKVMLPEVAAGENARERFLREGRAAAAVRSDRIITIYRVGEENGVPYLAMEFLEGMNLDDWLKARKGPPPVEALIRVAKDVLKGLAAAHEKGLIHRDIKPANLWVEAGTTRIKILDFGLTRGSTGDQSITEKGAVVGTPAYMAPEQAAGKPVDTRADLFSVGVVLYRMLAGKSPFQRETLMETLAALMFQPPPAAATFGTAVPAELAGFIDRLLAKNPDDRPQTATAAFAAVLEVEKQLRTRQTALSVKPAPQVVVPVMSDLPAADAATASWREAVDEPAAPSFDRPAPKKGRSVVATAGWVGLAATVVAVGVIVTKNRDGNGKENKHRDAATVLAAKDIGTGNASPATVVKSAPTVGPGNVPAVSVGDIAKDDGKTYTSRTTGMKFVRVKAGTFTMGSPKDEKGREDGEDAREVTLTKDYYLGTYEVTRGQFRQFVEAENYKTEGEADGTGGVGWDAAKKGWVKDAKYTWRNPGFAQTDEHPVVLVSWNDAVKFCEWLSRKDGKAYRLPSEAEWEFACRAGSKTRFHFGDEDEDLAKYGNVADADFQTTGGGDGGIKASDGYGFTAPVGRFKPNAFGLYDMHGNAAEWCRDYYGPYAKLDTARDPIQLTKQSDDRRVLRGGSCGLIAGRCRAARRFRRAPDFRYGFVGFRVSFRLD